MKSNALNVILIIVIISPLPPRYGDDPIEPYKPPTEAPRVEYLSTAVSKYINVMVRYYGKIIDRFKYGGVLEGRFCGKVRHISLK